MRVQFLQNESGKNGQISWSYRKGEKVNAVDLPSGESSAYRWMDLNVVQVLEEERAPQSSDAASPAAEEVPDVEQSDPPPSVKRRGRPPKNQTSAA